jgi:hypothetical protein
VLKLPHARTLETYCHIDPGFSKLKIRNNKNIFDTGKEEKFFLFMLLVIQNNTKKIQ